MLKLSDAELQTEAQSLQMAFSDDLEEDLVSDISFRTNDGMIC